MTIYIRKLQNIRHWDNGWPNENDVQADAARCLATQRNSLSVFALELENSGPQIKRIVAALALTRISIENIDLAVVERETLTRCDIKLTRTPANTPDRIVNEWHFDLVELTFAKILKIAVSIRSEAEFLRYNRRSVEDAIRSSVELDQIDTIHANPKIVQSLKNKGIDIQKSHT